MTTKGFLVFFFFFLLQAVHCWHSPQKSSSSSRVSLRSAALVDLAAGTLASTALSGAGDALAQYHSFRSKEILPSSEFRLDFARFTRFLAKGLGGAVIWQGWYRIADAWSLGLAASFLSHTTGPSFAGSESVVRTVISIVLEQSIAAPIIYSLWDIPLPALLNNEPLERIPSLVQAKIGVLLVENAKVWTPVNVIIYNVPLEWRAVVMNLGDLFWQTVVSSVASEEVVLENEQVMVQEESSLTAEREGPVLGWHS